MLPLFPCTLNLAPCSLLIDLCRVSKQITRMENEMLQAAKNLVFERSTELRDQLKKLRESVLISPL